MQLTRLGKISNISSSKRIYRSEYVEDGIPFYRGKEIVLLKNNKRLNDILYISKSRYQEIKEKFGAPQKNDILLTSVGTIGIPFLVKDDHPFYFKDGNLTWLRNDQNVIHHKFLYHWLQSPQFKNQVKSKSIGVAQPALTISGLKEFDISFPSISIQKKIASVLSTYDKLIDNNSKRIEILGEMAQRIYKEWFEDFKYPGYENDELVDSELGMIPESWKLNNLDKYVSFDRGTEPGSKNYQDNKSENTIPFLRVGDLSARNKHIYISKELAKEKILEKKDIVITLDGTVGIVKTGLEGCFSTGLRKCRIINDLINREFLFYTLKSRNIQSTIKAHATGSTILHASSSIKHMKFALPTNKIMNNFFEMINPILSEKQILTDKNYNLFKTRDYLLPKLISEKVDVSDLNIDTSILDD